MGFAPLWPGTMWDSVFLLALLHYATTLETHATDWRKKPPDFADFSSRRPVHKTNGLQSQQGYFCINLEILHFFPFGVVSLQK